MSKTIEKPNAEAVDLDRLVLPAVCWVHRPHALEHEISEGDDLCAECCAKRVAKYKVEYPEHADEILFDGGYDHSWESEGLATCADCGCDLSCYLLDTFDDVGDWPEEDRCIHTADDVRRANSQLDRQNVEERTNCLEPSGSVGAAVGLCRKAGVTKVKPAIHHQVIRFLMAAEGVAENIGGIAYSANSYSLDELRALADEVNEILSQNTEISGCEPTDKAQH